jgi:hypothetical protein
VTERTQCETRHVEEHAEKPQRFEGERSASVKLHASQHGKRNKRNQAAAMNGGPPPRLRLHSHAREPREARPPAACAGKKEDMVRRVVSREAR